MSTGPMRCVGRRDNCFRDALPGEDLCLVCWEAKHYPRKYSARGITSDFDNLLDTDSPVEIKWIDDSEFIGVISEWTPPERDVVPVTPLDSHMVEGREMKVVREVVPVDDAIEYGECPVCGAEPGQQCSVTDVSGWQPEGPAYVSTTELAGWVHPERER